MTFSSSSELPDPMEAAENRCEAWADEHADGDGFECPGCERHVAWGEEHFASPGSYSLPCCGECMRAAYPEPAP